MVGLQLTHGDVLVLSGGHLHDVVRVPLRGGGSAVCKLISPGVVPAADVAWLRRTERAARDLRPAGVDAVTAHTSATGDPVVVVGDGRPGLVFDFVAGSTVPPGQLPSTRQASRAGTVLGRLHSHALDATWFTDRGGHPLWPVVHVNQISDAATALGMRVTRALSGDLPLLQRWSRRYAAVERHISDAVVVGHGDFAPRNLIWHSDGVSVIDWEHAGPVHPQVEAAIAVIEWSQTARGVVREANADAFLSSYLSARDGVDIGVQHVAAVGGRFMSWALYNLHCAIDDRSGERHVRQALEAVRGLRVLDRRLPCLR